MDFNQFIDKVLPKFTNEKEAIQNHADKGAKELAEIDPIINGWPE